MKRLYLPCLGFALALVSVPAHAQNAHDYPWLSTAGTARGDTVAGRIAPPPGFARTVQVRGSFGHWLRHLPLRPPGAPVRLFNGRLKSRQDVHAAVVDIDVGKADLQQCADAVMRLRAEYLFSQRRADEIHFNFTSGDRIDFSRWAAGWRPQVRGSKVAWRRGGVMAADHPALGRYLRTIFTYAGSYSLSRELNRVGGGRTLKVGDIFLKGGFPGHAVIVVDQAENPDSGQAAFLLAQSYMPAQDIHILRNPGRALSPWYIAGERANLVTPEWTFDWGARYRFEAAGETSSR